MKRFLIYLLLFPAIATVSFYAVLYILTGAVVDSLSGADILLPDVHCAGAGGCLGGLAGLQNAHSCRHCSHAFRLWDFSFWCGLGRHDRCFGIRPGRRNPSRDMFVAVKQHEARHLLATNSP
jgi:hypothetical protein